MDFYAVLTEIMDEKKMTIPDVARACNLTDSTVRSIIDRKQKKIALNVAFKLHQGLGVSLERLNGMNENSAEPEISNPEKPVAREQLIEVLQKLGYLDKHGDISDDDLEFLKGIFMALKAHFRAKG